MKDYLSSVLLSNFLIATTLVLSEEGLFVFIISLTRSFVARLNSFNVFPNARPIAGNLDGPKIIKAMTKMMVQPGIQYFVTYFTFQ